jgi:zinc protease
VRRIVSARAVRRLETMEGQASWLAEWESQGDWRMGERYHEALLAATAAEVTEAAGRWLLPDAYGAVAYRPRDAAPLAADAAAFARLLDGAAAAPMPGPGDPTVQAPAVHAGRPRAERVEAGVHVFRTRGGVPVLVVPKPGARIVHLGASVLGGAVAEPTTRSAAPRSWPRRASRARRRARPRRSRGRRAHGRQRRGERGFETFGWGISVPTRSSAARGAPRRRGAARELPRRGGGHRARGGRAAAPHACATTCTAGRCARRRGGVRGHAYGRPVGGTEATLAAVTPRPCAPGTGRSRARAASVLALVGDVDPAEARRCSAAAFGELATPSRRRSAGPAWPEGVVVREDRRAKRQTALAMLFPGPTRRDPERVVAQLLAGVASGLGGRFFDELRDRRSLAYTVHAFAPARRCAGAFGAYIATGPEQEEEARAGLLAEFARLADGGVTADELERAQTYALGTHAIARQSGGTVLADAVDAWLLGEGLGELAAYEARVRGVTLADVRRLAARHFDPARRVEGVVRGEAAEPDGGAAGGAGA